MPAVSQGYGVVSLPGMLEGHVSESVYWTVMQDYLDTVLQCPLVQLLLPSLPQKLPSLCRINNFHVNCLEIWHEKVCEVQASSLQRSGAELKDGTWLCLSGAFFLEFRKWISNS